MTIAAASFFTAATAGASGQAVSGQPASTAVFADAMVGALATPSTGTAPTVAARPGAVGATPHACALIDTTTMVVPAQDATADPVATPLAPAALEAEAPAAPSIAPTVTGGPAGPVVNTRSATSDPASRIAQADESLAITTDASDQVAIPLPSIVPPSAGGSPNVASEVPPAVEPTGGEAIHEQEIEPEPVAIEQPISSTNGPATVTATPTPPTLASTLRPVDPEAADEPNGTHEAQPANASGKAAGAEGPREPAPATAVSSQAATFAERLPVGGEAVAAPGPALISGAAAQPAAVRTSELPASVPPPRGEPVVDARPGHLGREMGVEIAKRLGAGGEELTVRLNPVEMGRIEVRLSFDERGTLRAAVTAESAAALEMLRRDSADLGRALTDAGVRADADSFRFEGQSNGREGGQFWQRQQAANGRSRASGPSGADEPADLQPAYRAIRTSGRVDLVA